MFLKAQDMQFFRVKSFQQILSISFGMIRRPLFVICQLEKIHPASPHLDYIAEGIDI